MVQNTNFLQLFIYTLDIDINLLETNPAYPEEPKTLGGRIRKARMDNGMLMKELASEIGVTGRYGHQLEDKRRNAGKKIFGENEELSQDLTQQNCSWTNIPPLNPYNLR